MQRGKTCGNSGRMIRRAESLGGRQKGGDPGKVERKEERQARRKETRRVREDEKAHGESVG
jgi:hypothetical protein